MARFQVGRPTPRPLTSIVPAVGASKPASRLSSVVLPQPLWPMIEQNSRSAMAKLTSSSASTAGSRALCPAKILVTCSMRTSLIAAAGSSSLQRARPGQRAPADLANEEVEREADEADRDHADDDDVGAQQGARVVDQKAEAGVGADELGRDQRHPADPEADADAGDDLRQGGEHNDAAQHRAFAAAQAARRAHEIRLDTPDAGDGVEQDRKEDAEKDDELVLRVADAEPEDRKRNPGERRDRPQHLDQGVELVVDELPPAHRDAERHGDERPEEGDELAP